MLDTNVAIHLRDRNAAIMEAVAALGDDMLISVISKVELVNGVYADPAQSAIRAVRLDAMLDTLTCIPFDDQSADAYRRIIASVGYVRGRILDRMIAAQAIAVSAVFVTINGADFRDIPRLNLLEWPNPT